MSIISASTTSTTAYKVTADTTGTLVLQTGASPTTAMTIDGSQNVTLAGNITLNNGAADGAQLTLASSGFSNWNIDNFSGNFRWYYNATEYMRLDASGNLAVGISSPTFADGKGIHLNNSSGASRFHLTNNTTGTTSTDGSEFTVAGSDLYIINNESATMQFWTAATERARIDSSGNLLVGSTSSSIPSGYAFQWIQTVGAGAARFCHSTSAASGDQFAGFFYNGTGIGSITQNGTTGVLYNLTSDYRLKNNPTPVTGAKEFVMALQPKTWDWWDGSGKGVGFIAHEFMEVAHYSGHGEKDAVDEDGNPIYQSIQPSSSEVMANLVALLQEQQTTIETLTNRIQALENK